MNIVEKTIKTALSLVILAAFLQTPLAAQQARTSESDSVSQTQSSIYPIPILFYTPETGTAGGVAALFIYRDSWSPRTSSVTADVIATEKKQIITEISADHYFSRNRYRLITDILFQKYPNKFFGIGNNTPESSEETYTAQTFYIHATFSANVISHFNVGPIVRYDNVAIGETASPAVLATGILPGSKGGTSSGLGFVVNWDSRDNTLASTTGSFYQLKTMFFRSAWGSDYSYDDMQIDARKFFTPVADHIIAFQFSGEFMGGIVPFQSLAKFGGSSLLRGYHDGRFRDKNMIALQAEYRIPVWWRFGLVGFAGIAQVANEIGHFAVDQFHAAGGLGLRFTWNVKERVNIRVDYGAGNNSSGVYVTVTEAF